MIIDLHEFYADGFNRLKSDPQGADVREQVALGIDPDVDPDAKLSAIELSAKLEKDQLPPTPFASFTEGFVSNTDREQYQLQFTWYLHDAPEQGYRRINRLLSLVGGAYDEPLASVAGRLLGELEVIFISEGLPDPVLGTNFKFIRLAVPALGRARPSG